MEQNQEATSSPVLANLAVSYVTVGPRQISLPNWGGGGGGTTDFTHLTGLFIVDSNEVVHVIF